MNKQRIGNRVNAERIEIRSESSNPHVFLTQFTYIRHSLIVT